MRKSLQVMNNNLNEEVKRQDQVLQTYVDVLVLVKFNSQNRPSKSCPPYYIDYITFMLFIYTCQNVFYSNKCSCEYIG